ncbi:bifunctional riboflavin kinase/FAD synthetase [Paenibacillus alkalitolerans]|uniref:bifunctional riboflavin kinase/FAD synthetase n=1 Tax=Paenibacillus alkalitolerans TaxID=2799335 RepID=UPI0018F3A287|nr:bifunctional riboflavin kinase/FAD synthetase [Paenibacillus alkalitolerans]
MEVIRISYPLSEIASQYPVTEAQSAAIGDFDGVHLGHRQVIGKAVEASEFERLSSAVMTFHPHPREVLGSPLYSTYLTPLDRKLEQFEKLGADRVYIVRFDRELAKLSPSDFVERILVPLRVKQAVVGFNFTFGHRGAGTPETLTELAAGRFRVNIVEPFQIEGQRVSSTLIREALSQGDAAYAGRLLGRPYEIAGTVVKGEGRGSKIGIPTANVSPDGAYVTPATGVYAVTVRLDDGAQLSGVMNVGKKPTFHADLPEPTWEVHLFDFSGDLYGRRLTIELRNRIRSERRFESVDALVRQIHADIEQARRLSAL